MRASRSRPQAWEQGVDAVIRPIGDMMAEGSQRTPRVQHTMDAASYPRGTRRDLTRPRLALSLALRVSIREIHTIELVGSF